MSSKNNRALPTEPIGALASESMSTFRRSLTTPMITLLVVAMAAPLGSMIGNVPVGIILGNGAGLPIMFAVGGILVALAAVGYIALSRAVGRTGGFSELIRAGLGERFGRGAAYATALAYLAGTLSLAAGTGYFTSITLAGFGIDTPWYLWTGSALAIVLLLGRRGADFSSKVLFVLIAAEFALLIALDVSILATNGVEALPMDVFAPQTIFSGHLGPALMIGFTSFIGIESAIIYTREAKNPARAIPRATFAAVGMIIVFYLVSSWLIIGSVGTADIVGVAAESEGALVFAVAGQVSGTPLVTLLQIFFCLSLLATLIALHNATVRYVHDLSERGELPGMLSAIHRRHGSPARASDLLVGFAALLLGAFGIAGVSPYIGLGTSLTGLFTIGVIGVQAVVSVAVIVYFRRRRDRRLFATLIAPALGGAGIALATGVIAGNFAVLTGANDPITNSLPLLFLVAIIVGAALPPRRRKADDWSAAEDPDPADLSSSATSPHTKEVAS